MTVTAAQFVSRFGSEEIARRSASEGTVVSGALLDATIAGSDRSAWTSAEQAAADAALVRINNRLREADYEVELALEGITLTYNLEMAKDAWIAKLARYHLYDDNRPDWIRQDFDDFQAWADRLRRRIFANTLERT